MMNVGDLVYWVYLDRGIVEGRVTEVAKSGRFKMDGLRHIGCHYSPRSWVPPGQVYTSFEEARTVLCAALQRNVLEMRERVARAVESHEKAVRYTEDSMRTFSK